MIHPSYTDFDWRGWLAYWGTIVVLLLAVSFMVD